jgi:serine/threonine protein phosphatase PrpC
VLDPLLRVMMPRAHGATDRGCVRATNEDCYGIDHDLQLYVVADGMGGHRAGEVASRMAVDAIIEYVGRSAITTTWPFGFDEAMSPGGNLLRTAVHAANSRIFEAALANPAYHGMGTTAVAALVQDGVLSIAHVGDSRLYLFANRQLRQMTQDDSWASAVLAQDPDVNPFMLQRHPMRNALTAVVGSRGKTSVHLAERPLLGGERLALTTDGVHGVLDDEAVADLIGGPGDLKDVAGRLIAAALAAGSRDNCTAVIVDC